MNGRMRAFCGTYGVEKGLGNEWGEKKNTQSFRFHSYKIFQICFQKIFTTHDLWLNGVHFA